MRELYINDKLIELSDNELIGITYCANNIGELQNRNSSFSNTIKIPITQNNKIALDWSHLINSSTDLPYIKLKATYIENGIELVSNGTGIINSVDDRYFNVNILSGNSDLTELLGDKTIGELYELASFAWNKTNIIASNNKSKPYIYPVIDWYSDSDSFFLKDDKAKCDYLVPCLRIKDVFKKIEDYINFSFTGSYIQSLDHENMILTPDFFESEKSQISVFKSKGGDGYFLEVAKGSSTQTINLYPKIKNSNVEFGYSTYTYYQPLILKYGKLSFNGTIIYQWYRNGYYDWFQKKEKRNITITGYIKDDLGNTLAKKQLWNTTKSLEFMVDNSVIIDIETPENFAFSPLRKYYFYYSVAVRQHSNTTSKLPIFTDVYSDQSLIFEGTKEIVFNQSIKYSDIFRMKVKDVLKDILNLRGLIIQTNSYLRTIQINSFDDLIRNKSIAKDWSNKVNSISSLKYTFGNYAQKNYLKFKEIESVKKEYGNSYFSISNLNLDVDKTAVQIAHPATEQTIKYLGANIPKIKGLNSKGEWQKPQYRILTLNSEEIRTIKYIDTITTTELLENVPFCKFETFAQIIPVHYKALNQILDDTKVITATLKLNGKDVNELDFSIPIYLDVPEFSISNYFYINRINDYKKGLTNVELVRL